MRYIKEMAVYLRGFITEYIPNDSFKIELSSGNLFIVKETQIEKINFSQRRKKRYLKKGFMSV